MAAKERITIVVVGANDGKINDPIFNLVQTKIYNRTDIFLIEPNKHLNKFIEENYRFLKTKNILNFAIGPIEEYITLFAVKEDVWPDCQPSYAKGWPIYRAPTGITSSNREFVENWLKNNLSKKRNIEDSIVDLKVQCIPLAECLAQAGHHGDIDVLQIDVEGADDSVVYGSISDHCCPLVVHFESQNLPSKRLQNVISFLENSNYFIIQTESDCLCIRHGLEISS